MKKMNLLYFIRNLKLEQRRLSQRCPNYEQMVTGDILNVFS